MYQPLLWRMAVERAKEKGISTQSSKLSDAISGREDDRHAIAMMMLTLIEVDRMLNEKDNCLVWTKCVHVKSWIPVLASFYTEE